MPLDDPLDDGQTQPGSGADLQDPVAASDPERLQHVGDERRLRSRAGGIAVAEQGLVAVYPLQLARRGMAGVDSKQTTPFEAVHPVDEDVPGG